MAFSIKQVKAKLQEYGVPAENLDTAAEYFCAAHKTDLDAIKEQRDTYKTDAETLAKVQKELDDLKAAGDGGYKDKYDKVKKDFDDYKAGVEAKEAKTAKEKAVRAYYESKNITGKSLDIAMRGSAAEIDAVELENGKIKDAAALDELIGGTFAGLVSKTTVTGAQTDTPPANTTQSAAHSGRAAQIAAEFQKARYGEVKTEKTGGE